MELQSVCHGFSAPKAFFSHHRLSTVSANEVRFRNQSFGLGTVSKSLNRFGNKSIVRGLERRVVVCNSSSSSDGKLERLGRENSGVPAVRFNAVEPFRGKSGTVSFHGLTYQMVEERKLVSAPFDVDKGSFLWILAPVALISSLILPQLFIADVIEVLLREETLVEIVFSLVSEALFYIGFGTFLLVTDRVQRPYLQFSAKRWGLITGLRGYITASFFVMGLKVVAPLFVVYVTWPAIGFQALAAVVPFLVGCAVQFAFETFLDKRGSSCWPLVPIVFEVYRIYQLTRAAQFLQRLLFLMKDLPPTPRMMERTGAMFSMIITFQLLGVVCLWSLITFLLRLFPSRPVAENY